MPRYIMVCEGYSERAHRILFLIAKQIWNQ